jgi:hypothetical protein
MGETAAVEKHGLRESRKTGSVFFSVHVFVMSTDRETGVFSCPLQRTRRTDSSE